MDEDLLENLLSQAPVSRCLKITHEDTYCTGSDHEAERLALFIGLFYEIRVVQTYSIAPLKIKAKIGAAEDENADVLGAQRWWEMTPVDAHNFVKNKETRRPRTIHELRETL